MLYAPIEIEVSAKYLEKVFREMKGDVCLIEGWATYDIVGKNFEEINGRKYIGSRDVDIGFHIDEGWSEEQLKRSGFSAMIRLIEDIGFWASELAYACSFYFLEYACKLFAGDFNSFG